MRVLERRAAPRSARTQRLLLALAFTVLAVAGVIAWANLPSTDEPLRWGPLLVVLLVATPLSILLKSIEYVVSSRMVGSRTPVVEAAEVSVLAATANLLPIPGSLIVRVRALSEGGATYRQAISSTATISLSWLGFSLVLGGGAIVAAGRPLVGLLAVLGGTLALVVAGVGLRSQVERSRIGRFAAVIVAVNLSFIALAAVKLALLLSALGYEASVGDTVALTIAGSLSAALGFLPGGLGLREVLTAMISPLVGLPASATLLTTVIDRVAWLGGLAVASLLIVLRRRGTTRRAAREGVADVTQEAASSLP